MPTLTPGKPFTVAEPQLLVENRLAAGRHRFQLVVIDEAGLESEPAELLVTVREANREPVRPTRPDINPEILDRLRPFRPDIVRTIRRPP